MSQTPTEEPTKEQPTVPPALAPSPPAVSACATGYTPSPAYAKWGPRCYLVPPERSTSLFRCLDLCKEHGGIPACIGSAEENAFVTAELVAEDGLWLGLYQNETGIGPIKGWDRCVAGDAPGFTNWQDAEKFIKCDGDKWCERTIDKFIKCDGDKWCDRTIENTGYQEDCSWVAADGQWRDLACDGDVHVANNPDKVRRVRLAELSCLCAPGNASAGFADDVEALEAASGYNQRLLTRRTTNAFVVATAFAALPSLLLLGCWVDTRRRPFEFWPIPAAECRKTLLVLAFFQAGWALFAITIVPQVMSNRGQSIEESVGNPLLWFAIGLPLSFCCMCFCAPCIAADDDESGGNGGAYGGGGNGGGDGGGDGGGCGDGGGGE